MSKERITISPDLYDIMPADYQDLVSKATYGKEDRGWKDIGTSKELIEQHSLCAGCPESMAFRYILASLPDPEDTVMVGSTGCTSLVFPMVAVHNIHSLFGNQNAIASGLKRALSVRFPDRVKDVVVLAGDGATVDIGLDMTLQAWFRQEKFTTICFDNELYANTGGNKKVASCRRALSPKWPRLESYSTKCASRDSAGIRLSLHRELYGEQAVAGREGRSQCGFNRPRNRADLSSALHALHPGDRQEQHGGSAGNAGLRETHRTVRLQGIHERTCEQLLAERDAKAKEKKAAAKQLVS